MGSRGLICWQDWHREWEGGLGESGRELLAAKQADITRADTIKVLVVNEPSRPERRGWAMSASWGNAHRCESCLLGTGRIWRDFWEGLSMRCPSCVRTDSAGEVRLICGRSQARQWAEWRMKTNGGPYNGQWSSAVAKRERTGQELEHSVFTQVCAVARQLLWNNIESRPKAKLYVQTWARRACPLQKWLGLLFSEGKSRLGSPSETCFPHNSCSTFPYSYLFLSQLGKCFALEMI